MRLRRARWPDVAALPPWDEGSPDIGLPVFSHQARNGVAVDWLGTEGSVVAHGHLAPLKFAVACNSLARQDGRSLPALDVLVFAGEMRHEYAVHAFASTAEDWRIHWDGVDPCTPGAFPVTIWGTGW